MNDKLLLRYLNDHLAGSVVAVDLAEHCRDHHADGDAQTYLVRLLEEVADDQKTLRRLIECLGGSESLVKKGMAWLTEKVTRVKHGSGTPAERAFARMEQFEVLLVGVTGKRALWELLAVIAPGDDRLAGFDWDRLIGTANEQLDSINRFRVEAGQAAFTGT